MWRPARSLRGRLVLIGLPFLVAPGSLRPVEPSPPTVTQAPAPPSFGASVDVEVVEVQAFVTDGKGRPVSGLRAGDFRLLVDGEPRPIVNFYEATGEAPAVTLPVAPAAPAPREASGAAAAPSPAAPPPSQQLSLVVLLDELHIQPAERRRTLDRLRPLLAARLAAGDRVMVATLDRSLRVRRTFDDTAPLETLFAQLQKSASGGILLESEHRQTMRDIRDLFGMRGCAAVDEMTQISDAWAAQVEHESRTTLDALEDLLRRLAGRSGHKALLWVTSGLSLTPGLESRLLIAELCGGTNPPSAGLVDAIDEVSRVANGAQVTLYTLDAGGQRVLTDALDPGPGLDLADGAAVRSDLQDPGFSIATATGGRALLESNQPELLLADLTRDLATYYSLGFAPRPADGGRQHRIRVEVARPGLRVRHRSAWEPLSAEQRLTARVLAALALGGEESNPLQARLGTGKPRPRPDGDFDLPLELLVPAAGLALVPQGDRRHGSLRVLLALADAGGTTPVRSLALPVDLPADAPPGATVPLRVSLRIQAGASTLVVAVHDDVGQETSVLRRRVDAGAKR